MEEMSHVYRKQLCAEDPIAVKPDKITVSMKAHQLVGLYKAMNMERGAPINYIIENISDMLRDRWRTGFAYQGIMTVATNVGILGDLVGYGKTLTALSIIAATKPEDIKSNDSYTYSYHGRHIGKFMATCKSPIMTYPLHFIHSTLVIVPRGPVFVQWVTAINTQTTLRVLSLDGIPAIRRLCPPPSTDLMQLKSFFEQYDIVLIKNTTIKGLMDYYQVSLMNEPIAWDRIVVDEAHDIIRTIPFFDYKFLWLITASFDYLPQCMYAARTTLVSTVKDVITEDNLPFMMVKSENAFVRTSFQVPDYIEHMYVCTMPHHLRMVQPFLNPAALERINANDVAGAIREMGGSNHTESDIIDIVTRDIQKDIKNKELEETYITHLDIPLDNKENRLATIRKDLNALREKLQALVDRVSQLSTKQCSICYDNIENPTMIPCTHVFCGGCLLKWVRNKQTCPECRTPIKSKDIIAIVETATGSTSRAKEDTPLSKLDRLLKIIADKPNGRFIVVSCYESTFIDIISRFETAGVTYAEIKGSTATMMRILERFRNGELRVIMLNTHHAGSGIDISCATDVILFHKMTNNKTQAVGRAQRVGRREPLVVHNLMYPHEIDLE